MVIDMSRKKLSPKKIEALANEIRDWLIKNEMWVDTRIYFNNKAYTSNHLEHIAYNNSDDLIVIENINPKDYIDYCGDYLTMSFEGPLYDMLNYTCGKLKTEFDSIFDKYGLYYELGNAWNLSAYEK